MPSTPSTGNANVTTSAVTGLSGAFTDAVRFTAVNTANDQRVSLSQFPTAVTTVSFYAKQGTQGAGAFMRRGTSAYVSFDLTTGTVLVNNWDAGSAHMVDMGNGWYRCVATTSQTSAGASLLFGPSAGLSNGLQANAGDNVIATAFQMEAGAFPTSYIPTTGGTVERALDQCRISGDNFTQWFNQSEGTFLVSVAARGRLKAMACSTGPTVYQDTTYNFGSNGEDDAFYRIRFEDRKQIQFNLIPFGNGTTIPMQNYAGTYSSTLGSAAFEGIAASNQTITKALQNDLDILWIGNSTQNESGFRQHISRLAYYRRQLSKEQIVALTA